MLDQSVHLTGDIGEYFAELKASYLARIFGTDFSGKVLDFGCGVGLLSQFLLQYLPACRLHGYDPSASSIEQIQPVVYAKGKFTSREDELDQAYDLVVVANVMHHVAVEQRRETISDLYSRLAPGGHVVVFEHNPANPLTRWAVHICPFDVGVALLWPGEVRKYFEHAHLRTVRRDYITFFPRWFAWFRPLEPLLSWCPLGAQYVVSGRKSST
jgi:SAM-dependent methyltransferase